MLSMPFMWVMILKLSALPTQPHKSLPLSMPFMWVMILKPGMTPEEAQIALSFNALYVGDDFETLIIDFILTAFNFIFQCPLCG